MVDRSNGNDGPHQLHRQLGKDGPFPEQLDNRRRDLLNLMKGVAIAGPIFLTLKNTPALAQTVGEASCMSANVSGHDHADSSTPACNQFNNN